MNKEKKSFDFTSAGVLLVSASLILGGVYLLNQSQGKNNSAATLFSTSSISSKKTVSSINASSSIVLESSKIATSSLVEISSSSVAKSSSATSSAKSSSLATSSKVKSELPSRTAVIKVIDNLGAGKYKVKVTDSAVANATTWVAGESININNSTDLAIDTEYRVSDITESGKSFDYGLIVKN